MRDKNPGIISTSDLRDMTSQPTSSIAVWCRVLAMVSCWLARPGINSCSWSAIMRALTLSKNGYFSISQPGKGLPSQFFMKSVTSAGEFAKKYPKSSAMLAIDGYLAILLANFLPRRPANDSRTIGVPIEPAIANGSMPSVKSFIC